MILYGFNITEPKPFRNFRYYGHKIDDDKWQVMNYTPNGYDEFCSVDVSGITKIDEIRDKIKLTTQIHHDSLRNSYC